MNKKTRPWLRFIEGPTEDAAVPTGGDATDVVTDSDAKSEATAQGPPAVKEEPNEEEEASDTAASEKPQSEPAPEGEKADAELSQAQLIEIVKQLQAEIKEANQERAQAAEEKRLAVAADVVKSLGLPDALASRVSGSTREEMETDAKELAKIFGARATDPTQGKGGGKSAQSRMFDAIAARVAAAGLK